MRLSDEELLLLNCGAEEDSWESLGLQGGQTSSILNEINPDCSLERLMLQLKLQYFGHLMRRADSLKKTLMLRKTEDRRRRGQQRMRWFDGIIDSMDTEQALGDGEGQGGLACCSPWGCKLLDMTEQLNNNGSYYTVSYRSPRRGLWIERET